MLQCHHENKIINSNNNNSVSIDNLDIVQDSALVHLVLKVFTGHFQIQVNIYSNFTELCVRLRSFKVNMNLNNLRLGAYEISS